MKKRLRKKRHLKEFQELGFDLSIRIENHKKSMSYIYAVNNCLDSFNVEFGGGGGWWGIMYYVSQAWHSGEKITIEKQTKIVEALKIIPGIIKVEVGPLEDAWYGWRDK